MPNYTLAKRSGSPRWYIVWTEGRRSQRVPTGTEDHSQAELVLAAFRIERERPAVAQPDDLAIAQALEWYYAERAVKLPSAEQARIAIRHINGFYGASRISTINSVSDGLYEAKRREAGVGWATINRERMVLRAALRWAKKHHGLAVVPHIPTIEPDEAQDGATEPKGRPLSLKEMGKLLGAAKSEHIRLFILILIGTLCRPDAAKDLTPVQCDSEHRLIKLNPPGRRQTKKVRPIVPMPKFLRAALKGIKRKHVVEYHGGKIGSTKTAWRDLRAAAGLGVDVNPYSIRHTMARELRRRGVPGDQISIMLGHRPANASRTDLIYAPYEPGYCGAAVKVIDAIYREIARQSRAKAPVEKQGVKRKSACGRVVGATGIEPVTPTMSRKGRKRK